ncbi:DUF6789 family protein [Natrinema halophilum]|uniref:Uncharacterized protein n=1 Tax=Natrinema halophilum TaxID=1699371 RepID=A0A7D5GN13_9EURY|nr:DUF6789 family protein [Natrinema halophilum]QLG50552.1 hypothetical protein HYG82_17725 [Natrinema halophilum]
MGPIRSSIGGGLAATVVLTIFLLGVDALLRGSDLFVFVTFTSFCAIGGPPYCEGGSPMAAGLLFVSYSGLFALAWPLLFGGFTWAIPGETGAAHGVVFGFVLWTGYVVVLSGSPVADRTIVETVTLSAITLAAYLVYGLTLGAVYDYLTNDRTVRSAGTA